MKLRKVGHLQTRASPRTPTSCPCWVNLKGILSRNNVVRVHYIQQHFQCCIVFQLPLNVKSDSISQLQFQSAKQANQKLFTTGKCPGLESWSPPLDLSKSFDLTKPQFPRMETKEEGRKQEGIIKYLLPRSVVNTIKFGSESIWHSVNIEKTVPIAGAQSLIHDASI